MKHCGKIILVCLALSLAACGGGHLSVDLPGGGTLRLDFPPGQAVEHRLPFRISGGIPPYESSIEDCPDWVTLFPDQGVLAGMAPSEDRGKTYFCTYRVTESDPGFRPAQTVSYGLRLVVGSDTTRPLALPPLSKVDLSVGTFHDEEFPAATGGVQPYTYAFTCAGGSLPSGMGFAPATRRFAGTPDARFRDSCTYSVTDSSQPTATASVAVEVEVASAATRPLALPDEVVDSNRLSFKLERRYQVPFKRAFGGVMPYTYDLQCVLPRGLGFSSDTLILSGTPLEIYRGPDCTYRVTDSSSPPASVARSVALIVDPLDMGTWRFRTRSLPQSDHPLDRTDADPQPFVTLPHAIGGMPGSPPLYGLPDVLAPLEFAAMTRVLSYHQGPTDPLFDSPTTFRYLVGTETDLDPGNADDVLCVDVLYRDPPPSEEMPNDGLLSTVRVSVRDDAYHDGAEWRCPDTTAPTPRSSAHGVSNPVHEALAPVHARRALDVALGSLRDRVRGWTPGAPRMRSAITPRIGIRSLSGQSEGFDYTGSSESLNTGAEIGSGFWQAGVIGSFTRTELHYRAAESLAQRGYRSGEHTTEIFSLHPFAAWHLRSGGHLWASLGAGSGQLRHRDDLGFPSWSRSDLRLRAHAAGVSVPVADILSGEVEVEAGIEAFAFEIEGGDRISSSLPTLRGRDYRAGLTWSAPVRGAPSLSVAYKHLTGDGPEGGQLETRGSVSAAGLFDPRLTLTGNAEGSFGLGDFDHDSWGLTAGVRFAPGDGGRGFGLDMDTRLVSLDDGQASGVGIRGEAGYGLWGGPFFGTVRPYVGLVRHSSDSSVRRTLGVDLRDTPDSRIKVEVYDEPRDRLRALRFTLRHLF